MNTKYIIAIVAILVLISSIAFVYVNYSDQTDSSNGDILVSITDDTGYLLNLTSYPERVVSLAPSNTQIVFLVGAGDQVVGVTDYDNYPYDFSAWVESGNMSSIGNYYEPAIEPIVALNPDLILASLGSADAAEQLRSLGYNVLTLSPTGLDSIMENVIAIGRATNHEIEATDLVNDMQQRINAVVSALDTVTNRPKVYHEIWSDPYMSIGKGTFVDEVIKLAGGQNIFENASTAYPVVSSEAIIDLKPDIIVFPTQMGIESFWGTIDDVTNRPGWDEIPAISNSKIYTVLGDIIDEPGPRQIDSLELLAKIIHPERFGEYT